MGKDFSLILLVGTLLLGGCGLPKRGQVLTFTTLAQGTYLCLDPPSRNDAPMLQIISATQQIDQVCQTLAVKTSPSHYLTELRTQLHQLQYDNVFVIIALQGAKPSGGHRIEIQRVVQQNDHILVEAQFTEPSYGQGVTGVITDPYHVIIVQKGDLSGKTVQFDLIQDGKTVASSTHTIN